VRAFYGLLSAMPKLGLHGYLSRLQDSVGYGCVVNCTGGPDPAPYCEDVDEDYLTIRDIPVEASEARFGGFAVERTDWPPGKPSNFRERWRFGHPHHHTH